MKAFLFLLFLVSCQSSSGPTHGWQHFAARDDGISLERPLIYRAKTPSTWIRRDPSPSESIVDTMKSICEFAIMDKIRLTIHTFPINEQRIAAQAQVARWKTQFEELDPLLTNVTLQSNGGYIGLLLEAQGMMKGEEQSILGWSMNLANDYETRLRFSLSPIDQLKRADYTIKVVGPPDLLNRNKKDLIAFVQSFELIEELPAPL